MQKRALFVLPVLLALSGTAYAGDQKSKIDSFIPLGAENPNADGMAILHFKENQNETSVQIMLNDFTPNTVYDFELVSPTAGTAAFCDVLVTDQNGRAHYKATVSGNISDAEIVIYLSDDCSFTQDEVRALGAQTP